MDLVKWLERERVYAIREKVLMCFICWNGLIKWWEKKEVHHEPIP
jgi:hypothetical protein